MKYFDMGKNSGQPVGAIDTSHFGPSPIEDVFNDLVIHEMKMKVWQAFAAPFNVDGLKPEKGWTMIGTATGFKINAGGPGSGRHAMGILKAEPIDHWKKISGAQGSNPGGFYEHPTAGTKYYVKFPQKNPDQNNAEVLADKIYNHLGIPAKNSFLVMQNGKMGVASSLVPNFTSMGKPSITVHPDTQKGYMADAYLANWDVFGLGWDNLVKNGDTGAAHRIDTGGALNFRAQGNEKPFPKDAVLELTSLRQPDKQGATVWQHLSAKDEKMQARNLVDKLTDAHIEGFVQQAGYEGQKATHMVKTLIGRRDVIKSKYGL